MKEEGRRKKEEGRGFDLWIETKRFCGGNFKINTSSQLKTDDL
jgi:hypothetical protein